MSFQAPLTQIWPKYSTGPVEHMRALGIISANYNLYEGSLFGVWSHHFIMAGLSYDECQHFFHEQNNKDRLEGLKFIFGKREKELAARKHASHLIKHFNKCMEKRHVLIHSWIEPPTLTQVFKNWSQPGEIKLRLLKRSKDDWQKLNFMQLSLNNLRGIADDIHRGHIFARDLATYLLFRDRPIGPLGRNGLLGLALPGPERPTLPQKRPIPRKLKLRLHPAIRAAAKLRPSSFED